MTLQVTYIFQIRIVLDNNVSGLKDGSPAAGPPCSKSFDCGHASLPVSEIQLDAVDVWDKADIDFGQEPDEMSRVFAYCRVSTDDQHVNNQIGEIEGAGFKLQPRRIVSEVISGSSAADQRPGFQRLLDRLETDDILVVTKPDRLGRNAMDVTATVERLSEMGVRVHYLALGGADLTSAAGRMVMGVLNVVAQFERDLLIERTHAGLERARAEGRALGRPTSLDPEQQAAVRDALAAGSSVAALAREYETSRQTIMRVRAAAFRAALP
jgi:putative DNA-invertase from lambdoid prophage Rac